MKHLPYIITVLSLSIMATSFIPGSNKKTDHSIIKNAGATANDSDTLIYSFHDATTAPNYHRSYTVRVTPGQIYFSIDVYGDTILKKYFALAKITYDSFARALDSLHIKKRKEVQLFCSGGTSNWLTLYPGSSREVKGYFNHCGGQVNGNLEGDVDAAVLLFNALIPDLYERIDATKKSD